MDNNKNQKPLTHEWFLESVLIILLIIFTFCMFASVEKIQGSAHVVNYTGIVRGATQRLVKLEIMENYNDELMNTLDEILVGLENGGGKFELTKLKSPQYNHSLQAVTQYWERLKKELLLHRENKNNEYVLLEMSEEYFDLANDLVNSAEEYSQNCAYTIRTLEGFIGIDLVVILYLLIKRTTQAILLYQKNEELSKSAYVDIHTGLPNKNKCELLLASNQNISVPTCCIMFDLNGLKHINDTLGHVSGDALIFNFARLIRINIPKQHFVGRYGGDEFIAVIENKTKNEVEQMIDIINDGITLFNKTHDNLSISYAYGCAFSEDYEGLTLTELLIKADYNMYAHKKLVKQST